MRRLLLSAPLAIALAVTSTAGAMCWDQAAQRYGINADLLRAIAQVESNMNPQAIHFNRNGSYDYGLMQINSRWYRELDAKWKYLADPCYNVMVGAWILRRCIDRYGYTWDSVACYHTGRGISQSTGRRRKQGLQYVEKVSNVLEKTHRLHGFHSHSFNRSRHLP